MNSDFNMFGGDMFIEGTWYNPRTGDKFTVRDTFFGDDTEGISIMTTDGRRISASMLDEYVKSTEPIGKKPTISPNQPVKKQGFNNNILEGLDQFIDTPDSIIDNTMQSERLTQPITTQATVHNTTVESEDERLIKRVLKSNTKPDIDVKLKWNDFPYRQLDCLLNIMGVDGDDISKYYISNLDIESIKNDIADQISSYIKKQLSSMNSNTAQPTNTDAVEPKKIKKNKKNG